jgi:ATP-dependent helicase/nuclease subunit A
MTLPVEIFEPADASERERAATTFDRNLVVTAGAGTGKTTLLVDRLVHLLMREPAPVKITEIVALTFTNKAANEIKLRLRERLQSYLSVRLDRKEETEAGQKIQQKVRSLIDRYRLSKSDLDERAYDALRNIERSEIGTIHSFAATLLRLYPMEAGVDPQFREDDGTQFERVFDEQWALWLDQELALQGARKDNWKTILKKLTLDQIKHLAVLLCSESVELSRFAASANGKSTPDRIRSWLGGFEAKAADLLERHPEDRLNEKLVRAAKITIHDFLDGGTVAGADETALLLSGKAISKKLKGWEEREAEEAQQLVRAARGLCRVDEALTDLLGKLLIPFIEKLREIFVYQGFVSFDGLLIRARNLVRDHPRVREELKRHYQAILIDEFQDTDPTQYEILLYLAEETGRQARAWGKVKLTSGKVFVVGDPKQSIYAFRRADIEAYLEVIEKFIKAQDGVECLLTTNFRSRAAILDVVNGVFGSLIRPQPGLQPPYIAIHAAPGREAESESPAGKVIVRKVVSGEDGDDALDARTARRLEAESLARWLKEEILEKAEIVDGEGKPALAKPRDVAILFRKLTDIQDYLEPLRRRDIRYVVEGERHFYTVKEIIDAVNVLRTVENPYDKLALVGVLRSPLGGLTDEAIYRLHRENLLDYRAVKRVKENENSFPAALAELYASLDQLHAETRTLPVGAAVTRVFDALPLKPLAACTFHGEQAVANLEKLRLEAELLGREGSSTLRETIRQLQRRVLDVKEEGESVLAEENVDAVRIMSIHKGKGLEFPIVVLAGCHTGTDAHRTPEAEALFDWSTGLTGLRFGQTSNLAGLYIEEKARLRLEEEQKRVLYVAMTRARERLVISCAPGGRRAGGSFLSMLDETLQEGIETAEASKTVTVGNGRMDIQVVTENLVAPGKARAKKKPGKKVGDWNPYIEAWKRRREAYQKILETRLFVTPTFLKRREEELAESDAESARRASDRVPALLLGEIAHRFLQEWDFTADAQTFRSKLTPFVEKRLATGSTREQDQIPKELEEIFDCFFSSPVYRELSSSRILGREVPLLMPWDGQIMEGVIDLMYEKDGRLYLADYKSDRIGREEMTQAAERYRHQAQIYSQAARQSLQREVAAFHLIFLRLGEAVEVEGA